MNPLVAVVMGSASDWPTMRLAVDVLERFGIPHETAVVSAHRMPDDMFEFAEKAAARGLRAIIAGAGGAAHLPGMLAAKTTVPVLGVPVASQHLQGQDSLLSIVQMPAGVPVATFAIGERSGAGARLEAAALAARSEVTAARARDARAQEAVTLYAGGIRTLARQNLEVVRQTFDFGRATVFDVLAEQRRYLDVEQAYTTALREAWEARATLKRALGETK